jgi:CheY-like chemotaxis protein
MKTQDYRIPSLTSWQLRRRLAEIEETSRSLGTKAKVRSPSVVLSRAGRPVGWMERTLLAVDTDRAFVEVSDPGLRQALVAAFEAEGRDVIATSNRRALLAFMEELPIPDDSGDDLVVAEDDASGSNAAELRRQLRARGWSIPVLPVSTARPRASAKAAS